MTRELVILIVDGQIRIFGDDLPDLSGLEDLVGQPDIDKELEALGINPALNTHLCG